MRRASTFDRQPKVQSNETKVEVKKQLVGVAWTHNLHPTTGLCWTTIFFPLSSQCSLSRPPWHHIWRPFFGLMVLVMVMANPKSHFVLKKYWSTPPLTTQSPKQRVGTELPKLQMRNSYENTTITNSIVPISASYAGGNVAEEAPWRQYSSERLWAVRWKDGGCGTILITALLLVTQVSVYQQTCFRRIW